MSNYKRDEDIVMSVSDDKSYHLEGHDGNFNEIEEQHNVTNNDIDELKHMDKSDKGLDIESHPIAGIFPMMNAEEFERLKFDIEKNGLIEPIWTYNGLIVDGRNRYKVCKELGIKPKLKEWKSENGIELIDFVISMNVQRRHLNASQKALVAVDALPYYEKVAKKRKLSTLKKGKKQSDRALIPERDNGRSRDIVAKVFGVSGRYVQYGKAIKGKDLNLTQEIRDGKKSITEARKQIKKTERICKIKKNGKKYKPDNDIKNDIQIVRADFYQWCKDKRKDNSIDLILTEPPCTKKDLHLWEKLAEESARVLKPSSFIVAYCGHGYIDKVVQILSKHLTYHLLYCIGLNGNGKKHCLYNVIEKWQAVLAYFKPPFKHDRISKKFLMDIGKDTRSHSNKLPEKGISYFMEMLSTPADVVLDPMLGTGGVLRVAKRLNRKFIGIGKDSDCVENAQGMLI